MTGRGSSSEFQGLSKDLDTDLFGPSPTSDQKQRMSTWLDIPIAILGSVFRCDAPSVQSAQDSIVLLLSDT